MRPHAPALVLVTLIVSGQVGCARTSEERQLDSMRADIERIQQERDRTDLPALAPDAVRPEASAAAAPASAPMAVPATEVVRVGTNDEAVADDYADPDDTTPRPIIRVSGAGAGLRGRESRQGEAPADAPASDESPSMQLDPDAKRAYDAALSFVNAKQYGRGLESLTAFLVKWPDHPYADHAMYWRGECYFAQGDYARAAEEFQGVLSRFPEGAKAPDALLKLGVCNQKLGRFAQAKECFERLAQDYPQAEAVRHIPPIPTPAGAPSGPASEDHR
jgi:tol-pal system protein YbgF